LRPGAVELFLIKNNSYIKIFFNWGERASYLLWTIGN